MPIAKPGSSPTSFRSSGTSSNDFTDSDPDKRQCVALIYGDPKTGKTTFVTDYCPAPIAFINFDGRDYHAIKKAREKGRKIWRMRVEYDADNVTQLDHAQAKRYGQEATEKTLRNIRWAANESRKGNIKTICLDTGTEYDCILKLAVRGTLENVQNDFGKSKSIIDQQWSRVFDIVRASNAHLIILARKSEVWTGGKPTGVFSLRGNDQMEILADWSGHIRVKRKRKDPPRFELEIMRSGVNIGEMGNIYTADDWAELGGPFAYACLNQYPDSDLEDWQ